jgi:hypothetical protein
MSQKKKNDLTACYNSRCYLKEKCFRWQQQATAIKKRLYPQAGAYCTFYIEGDKNVTA